MNRRTFLRVTGAVSATGLTAGCIAIPRPGGGEVPPAEAPVRPAVSLSEAEVIVTTVEGLIDEATTGMGRIIGVEDGNYDLTGTSFATRNWIAGRRGQNGSPGPLLYTNDSGVDSHAYRGGEYDGVITLLDEGRLTGVRLVGAEVGNWDSDRYDGYHPQPNGSYSERMAYYDRHHGRGVTVLGRGCSVDNCEIRHFATQGIVVGGNSTAVSPAIHDNSLTNMMMTSAGYCVDVKRGMPRIERNYMNASRHSICGFGYADCGYVVRGNVFGPHHSSHIVDMHRLGNNLDTLSSDPSSEIYRYRAGGQMEVVGNEFQSRERIPEVGGINEAVHVRGVPAKGFSFLDNVLPWQNIGRAVRQSGVPDRVNLNDLGFAGLHIGQNQLGATG